jgi:cbb3-type cytochrome oxidase subunit 3
MLLLPLAALFLFIIVFAGMFIVTMKKRAPAYDPLARMPLEDDGDDAESRDAQKGAR